MDDGLAGRDGFPRRQARERGEHRFEPGVSRVQSLLDLIENLLLTGRQAHLVLRGSTQREILLCTVAGGRPGAIPRMASVAV